MAKKKTAAKAPQAEPAQAAPAQPNGTLKLVPVRMILESHTNPRKTFDQAGLEELAASIKSKGILQPLLIRQHPKFSIFPATEKGKEGFAWLRAPMAGVLKWCATREECEANPVYELIAGERRWRAAKLAGLSEVPCVVSAMSDLDAAECQVIENEQREDVTPLEKAEGYYHLMECHKVTVDEIAQKIGKSASSVRGILKLRQLPEKAKGALSGGYLSMSTAQLLARIPDAKEREKATDHVLGQPRAEGFHPLPFLEAKKLVEQNYMVELKGANFDPSDEQLDPTAGSCTKCPHRAGNNPDCAGSRPDVCTNPPCFVAKLLKVVTKNEEEAKSQGRLVMSRDEARMIFGSSTTLGPHTMYIDLAAPPDPGLNTDGKLKDWEGLIGKDKRAKKERILAHDNLGHPHWLLRKTLVREILEEKQKKAEPAKPEPQCEPQSAPAAPLPLPEVADWAVARRADEILWGRTKERWLSLPLADLCRHLARYLLLSEAFQFAGDWEAIDVPEPEWEQPESVQALLRWVEDATEVDVRKVLVCGVLALAQQPECPDNLSPKALARVLIDHTQEMLLQEARQQLEAEREERRKALSATPA